MSPTTETKLRSAEPTIDEGRRFARYLDQAADGFFGMWLGRRAESILAAAYVQPDHDLSFERVTFAEREGNIVGMALAYSCEQHRRSSDLPLARAAGRWHPRMMIFSIALAPTFRVLRTMEDGDFYLQAIAVDPAARGAGIGSSLMDATEERAIASGATRLTLDVSAANAKARGLYERRGMTVESQWPRRLRIPRMTLVRMSKTL